MAKNNSTKANPPDRAPGRAGNKPSAKGCEKYEQAITHFVLGEQMDITKEKLFAHLKVCKECRKDLTEWQDTMTVMKMEAFSKTPEGKAKMQQDLTKLKERMKRESLLPPVKEDITVEKIGWTAGNILKLVATQGPVSLPDLPEKANTDPYLVISSIGWLAREGKVSFDHTKTPPDVILTPQEQARFRRQNGP